MQMKKSRKFVGTVLFCLSCTIAHPAHAFVWPTIDVAEIASIINDITNGSAKITGAIAQVKNYTSTISAIGSQKDMIEKYAKELKSGLIEIKSKVDLVIVSVNKTTNGIVDVEKNVAQQVRENSILEKKDTETIVSKIETAVNNGGNESDILDEIKKTETKIIIANREDETTLNLAHEHITKQTDSSQKVINQLVSKIIENEDLDSGVRSNLKNQAELLDKRLSSYREKAINIIGNLQENVSQKNETVKYAYNEYNSMVQNYYKGNAEKNILSDIGKKLNETVQNTQVTVNNDEIEKLADESKIINREISDLGETILDNIANIKEYSDEDEPLDKVSAIDLKKSEKFSYYTHEENRNMYLKGVYADKSGEDKSFLISYELGSDNASKCQKLNFEDIMDDNINDFIDNLRDCVVRAKAEKEHFCPNADAETLKSDSCDPYVIEKRFKKYKKEGVYKHILQDYGIENTTNLDKTKQYISTWLDTENKESTLNTLITQLEKSIDQSQDGVGIVSVISLELPKFWSLARRADALMRAKTTVDLYRQQETLYLDGDKDFKDSEDAHLGLIKEDGKAINVISNGILYGCKGKGLEDISGEKISVEPKDKYNNIAIEKAEETIKKCFFRYAEGSSKGTIDGKPDIGDGYLTIDMAKEKWRNKATKAHSDSVYHTFALSTINNYKSSLDYNTKIKEPKKNIITLQKNIKEESLGTVVDDYTSGAEIINYSTRQLISIIDADAQSLQSEIIADIKSMSYDYFDTETKGE